MCCATRCLTGVKRGGTGRRRAWPVCWWVGPRLGVACCGKTSKLSACCKRKRVCKRRSHSKSNRPSKRSSVKPRHACRPSNRGNGPKWPSTSRLGWLCTVVCSPTCSAEVCSSSACKSMGRTSPCKAAAPKWRPSQRRKMRSHTRAKLPWR